MLMHSFVLDALETTGADTFSHFEMLIDEHIKMDDKSRLKQLVPTVGVFHTRLPLRQAFEEYNRKHKLTKRKHITISFNEIRHILNLAQVMALAGIESSKESTAASGIVVDDNHEQTSEVTVEDEQQFVGPKLVTFDGDQTLYSDGANFESNPQLANYMHLLLQHGVTVAVVTAAGYEYNIEKYEFRLSGLLAYFRDKNLPPDDCARFYLFGGECNYLLQVSICLYVLTHEYRVPVHHSPVSVLSIVSFAHTFLSVKMGSDYRLHAVRETGPGGWLTSTKYLQETPGNWNDEDVTKLLDAAEHNLSKTQSELNLRSRVLRKKRSVGLVPLSLSAMLPREALDEAVLRVQAELTMELNGALPFCAFNGGRDVWVDVGNKRVGVQILASYAGIPTMETLHIGDQFLNTGNDFAARAVCPCIWITSPEETTYILKSILRLANIPLLSEDEAAAHSPIVSRKGSSDEFGEGSVVNFDEIERRTSVIKHMDVFTGEVIETYGGVP